MIDRFEDIDKHMSPSWQEERGRRAAKMGHPYRNPLGPEKPADPMKAMLWNAYRVGYIRESNYQAAR